MNEIDFDEIKRIAYDKFEYDIGPLKEVQLLFFLVSLALQKSELQFQDIIDQKIAAVGNKISETTHQLDEHLDALVEIYRDIKSSADSIKDNADSARESVIQAIKAGSLAVATQTEASVLKLTEHMETTTSCLLKDVTDSVTNSVAQNVDKHIAAAIERKFNEAGNPLVSIIGTLKTTTDETERHATNIIERLSKSNRKTLLFCLGSAVVGSSLTFLSLLLLQSAGIISIPFQVSLDAHMVAQYIVKALQTGR